VAASLELSEYILYGAFCETVIGLETSGHFASQQDLCHCCWFSEDAEALLQGRDVLREGGYALLLQSNLGLSRAEENSVLDRAVNAKRQLEAC
jgi:hypothetical protein